MPKLLETGMNESEGLEIVSGGCRALALPIVLPFTSIFEELPRRFQLVVWNRGSQ
jgi:hypothetical protein